LYGILSGAGGSGKSLVLDGIGNLVGLPLSVFFSTVSRATDRFNGILGGKRFGAISESNDSKMTSDEMSRLKDIATAERLALEAKYKDLITVYNYIVLFMCSNNRPDELAATESGESRRAAVYMVSPRHKGDKAYFDPLAAAVKHEMFPHALYTWLVKFANEKFELVKPWEQATFPIRWRRNADEMAEDLLEEFIKDLGETNLRYMLTVGEGHAPLLFHEFKVDDTNYLAFHRNDIVAILVDNISSRTSKPTTKETVLKLLADNKTLRKIDTPSLSDQSTIDINGRIRLGQGPNNRQKALVVARSVPVVARSVPDNEAA
jgi:hypothetical protein